MRWAVNPFMPQKWQHARLGLRVLRCLEGSPLYSGALGCPGAQSLFLDPREAKVDVLLLTPTLALSAKVQVLYCLEYFK